MIEERNIFYCQKLTWIKPQGAYGLLPMMLVVLMLSLPLSLGCRWRDGALRHGDDPAGGVRDSGGLHRPPRVPLLQSR